MVKLLCSFITIRPIVAHSNVGMYVVLLVHPNEKWFGNYIILHHANVVFSLLRTIFDDIKVVPLKTLRVLTICPRDGR